VQIISISKHARDRRLLMPTMVSIPRNTGHTSQIALHATRCRIWRELLYISSSTRKNKGKLFKVTRCMKLAIHMQLEVL